MSSSSIALLLGASSSAALSTMNPHGYTIANPLTPGVVPPYRGEYFEVLGPLETSRYSEVVWRLQMSQLPADIVARYDNRVMAVTGYEVDIVRARADGSEESVPCSQQYNHHFTGFMHGKAATMVVAAQDLTPAQAAADMAKGFLSHGKPLPRWSVAPHLPVGDAAAACSFTAGGGGDTSTLWLNPTNGVSVNITASPTAPNTWTADCVGPAGWRNATIVLGSDGRTATISDPTGVSDTTGVFATSTNTGAPPCSAIDWGSGGDWGGDWFLPAYAPGKSTVPSIQAYSEGNGNEHRRSFHGYAAGVAQLIASPTFFQNSAMIINGNKNLAPDAGAPGVVSLLQPRKALAPRSYGTAYNGLFECPCTSRKPKQLEAYARVGAGSAAAADPTGRVPCAGMAAAVVETATECAAGAAQQKVGAAVVGALAVVNDSSIVYGCFLAAGEQQLYFNNYSLPMGPGQGVLGAAAAAAAAAPVRDAAAPPPSAAITQVCRDVSVNAGTINKGHFDPSVCAPFPTSELVEQGNSVCNISAYGGGLKCCQGGSFLLDAEQEVPPANDTWRLKYRFYHEDATVEEDDSTAMAPSHRNVYRVWWSTEATNNEYDVPKSQAACDDAATPAELCVHTIRSQFHGADMLSLGSGCMVHGDPNGCINASLIAERDGGHFDLLYAGAHCHSPACISVELWNNDTGELLCRNAPTYGNGSSAVHDEVGFAVGIPPCVWGSAEEGLQSPPRLHLTSNLTTIKHANNTHGHWGVMALWQMRAAYIN